MSIQQAATGNHVFAVTNGFGLEPEFAPGDELYIDHHRTPAAGDYVLARLPESHTMIISQFTLRKGMPTLKPLNPSDPVIMVHRADIILGVVVYRGRSFE